MMCLSLSNWRGASTTLPLPCQILFMTSSQCSSTQYRLCNFPCIGFNHLINIPRSIKTLQRANPTPAHLRFTASQARPGYGNATSPPSAPDLRGHGESDKPKHGFQVSRLAMDLRELVLGLDKGVRRPWKAIGGSLGCSILWCYASLFTTSPFTHMVFVDQSPLQNSTLDGWDSRFCNRGMNNPQALAALQTTLKLSPETAHKGTILACLAYRAFPLPGQQEDWDVVYADEAFFLGEAMKGHPEWLGKLMADHTALDWRDSIAATFGEESGSCRGRGRETKVLVVASRRSGCFPAAGPMKVVELVNGAEEAGNAQGVVVDWGGHWCYWEDAERFNGLVLRWLDRGVVVDEVDEGTGREELEDRKTLHYAFSNKFPDEYGVS